MRSIVLAMALAAVGCNATLPTAVPIDVAAGQEFELAIGQSARLTGPIATIAFVSVPEDARCPSNALVLCVWAGNARVRLQVVQSGRTDTLELNTGIDPKEGSIGTLLVRLNALSPISVDGTPVPFARYRASIIATGRAD